MFKPHRQEPCRSSLQEVYESGIRHFIIREHQISDLTMSCPACELAEPYPGWECHTYRLSRPLTGEDVAAFLGNEELYVRDTPAGLVNIIHKYGILEIHGIVGKPEIWVWSDPEKGAYPSEYLDALLMTRF